MLFYRLGAVTVLMSLAGCQALMRMGEQANPARYLRVVDREVMSSRTSNKLSSITVQNTSRTLTFWDIEIEGYDRATGQALFPTTLVEPIGPGETKRYELNLHYAGNAEMDVRWLRAEHRSDSPSESGG